MDLDLINLKLQLYVRDGLKNFSVDSGYVNILNEMLQVCLEFPETPASFEIPEFTTPKQYAKIILVSGGADSTIMWYLHRNFEDKTALFIDVGTPYSIKEKQAAEKYIDKLIFQRKHMFTSPEWKHIVPGRNLLLLTEAEKLCKHEGEIWLGAVQGETSEDSGDKSQLFFNLFEELIWRTKRKKITIKTLKDKTKNDWLKWYIDHSGDIDVIKNTITCFDGTGAKACGRCQACLRKRISMAYCGIDDVSIFDVDPFLVDSEFIEKYKKNMQIALDTQEFGHYSQQRCLQDLEILNRYTEKTGEQSVSEVSE